MRRFAPGAAALIAALILACGEAQDAAPAAPDPVPSAAPAAEAEPAPAPQPEPEPSAEADLPEDLAAMPPGEARDIVHGVCAACHSMKLVFQQRLSRARWDKLLDWMVEEQGMAELDPETRTLVLDYLAEHYGVPE